MSRLEYLDFAPELCLLDLEHLHGPKEVPYGKRSLSSSVLSKWPSMGRVFCRALLLARCQAHSLLGQRLYRRHCLRCVSLRRRDGAAHQAACQFS